MAMCDEGLQALKKDYKLYVKVVQVKILVILIPLTLEYLMVLSFTNCTIYI